MGIIMFLKCKFKIIFKKLFFQVVIFKLNAFSMETLKKTHPPQKKQNKKTQQYFLSVKQNHMLN